MAQFQANKRRPPSKDRIDKEQQAYLKLGYKFRKEFDPMRRKKESIFHDILDTMPIQKNTFVVMVGRLFQMIGETK